MICPRCGKHTDESYPNCVNCGFLVNPPKADETVDKFAKLLVWLIIIVTVLSVVVSIAFLVRANNMVHGVP